MGGCLEEELLSFGVVAALEELDAQIGRGNGVMSPGGTTQCCNPCCLIPFCEAECRIVVGTAWAAVLIGLGKGLLGHHRVAGLERRDATAERLPCQESRCRRVLLRRAVIAGHRRSLKFVVVQKCDA